MKKLVISLVAAASLVSGMAFATSLQQINFVQNQAGNAITVSVSKTDNAPAYKAISQETSGKQVLGTGSPDFYIKEKIQVSSHPAVYKTTKFHCHVVTSGSYLNQSHQAFVQINDNYLGDFSQSNGSAGKSAPQTPFVMGFSSTAPYCNVVSG